LGIEGCASRVGLCSVGLDFARHDRNASGTSDELDEPSDRERDACVDEEDAAKACESGEDLTEAPPNRHLLLGA